MVDIGTTQAIAHILGVPVVTVLVVGYLFWRGGRRMDRIENNQRKHEDGCAEYRKEMRGEMSDVKDRLASIEASVARIEGKLDK